MFDYIYQWDDLSDDSPLEDTRNYWLFKYGAFGRYRGIWFACTVVNWNFLNNPYAVLPVRVATANMDLYPQGEIKVDDMDVFYSVFPNGQSLEYYISYSMRRKRTTDIMLDAALERSLNTELIYAPRRLIQGIKRILKRGIKSEPYVLDEVQKDEIGSIELPRTVDIVEKLWNSNDWSIQEVSQLLGISYNPAHGKKERMLQAELLGDRDITIMNRRKVTQRLVTAANNFGESVKHISTSIDVIDRGLSYEKGEIPNADLQNNDGTESSGNQSRNEVGEL